MREDLLKTIEYLKHISDDPNSEFIPKLKEIAPDAFNENGDIEDEEILGQYRDEIFKALFPSLVKYNLKELAKEVYTLEDCSDYRQFFELLFPTEFGMELFRLECEDKGIDILKGSSYYGTEHIDYLISRGYSVKEIYAAMEPKRFEYYLYTLDKSIIDSIELTSYSDVELIAEEFINGNKEAFRYLLSYRGLDKHRFAKFVEFLADRDKFDVEEIYNMMQLYVDDYVDSLSSIKDPNLVRKIVEKGGSKAIIFALEIPDDLIDEIEFEYNDYKVINGGYKNNTKLMEKLVGEGHKDAILYANTDTITESNVSLLDSFTFDEIKSSGRLVRNPWVIKYCVEKGYDIEVEYVKNLLLDVNVFDMMMHLCAEYNLNLGYSWGSDIAFVNDFANMKLKPNNHYSFNEVSVEVVEKAIEYGLTVEQYITCLPTDKTFDEVFLSKGNLEVLIRDGANYQLVRDNLSNITYEMVTNFMSKYPSITVTSEILYKFIKEGHYDLLEKLSSYVRNDMDDLALLGLDTLTYEEYLVADPRVRDLPSLKAKFASMDASIEVNPEMLKNNPELLYQKVINGMTYEEFSSYMSEFSFYNVDERVILHYLKQGHVEILEKGFSYNDPEKIVSEYIKILEEKGKKPSPTLLSNYRLRDALVKYYLEKKDFSIVPYITSFSPDIIKILFDNGYGMEQFKENPVLSSSILIRLINDTNEKELMDVIRVVSREDKHYRDTDYSGTIVRMYRCGWNIDNLNYFLGITASNYYSQNIVLNLFKELKPEEYKLFEDLNIDNIFQNKLMVDSLLPVLSSDRIKKALEHTTGELKNYAIKRMVELGHNDFIDCYTDVFDDDVIKRSLMSGYFPKSGTLNSVHYREHIRNIKFTSEELEYLRTRIDTNPILIIYFPDIMKDKEKVKEYLFKEPLLIRFCGDEFKYDLEFLDILYQKERGLFFTLACDKEFDLEVLIQFFLNGEYDIDYFPATKKNEEVINRLIDKYPNIIDGYYYTDSDMIERAINSGYKLNDESDSKIISKMISLGKADVNDEKYFNKLSVYDLISIISNISYDSYIASKDVLEPLFAKALFNKDSGYNVASILYNVDDVNLKNELNFTFYLSQWFYDLEDKNISPEIKELIYKNLVKYGNNPMYIDFNNRMLRNLLGDEFLAKKFLEDLDFPLAMMSYLSYMEDVDVSKIKDRFIENLDYYRQSKEQMDIIVNWFFYNGYRSNANTLAIEMFDKDPKYYAEYITEPDKETLDKIVDLLRTYPEFIDKFEISIDDKDLMLFLLEKGRTCAYTKCKNDLVNDLEVCNALLNNSASNIIHIKKENPYFKELVLRALKEQGFLYSCVIDMYPDLATDVDVIKNTLYSSPNTIFDMNASLFTKENFQFIEHFERFDFDRVPIEFMYDILDVMQSKNVTDEALSRLFKYFVSSDNKDYLIGHPYMVQSVVSEVKNENSFRNVISIVRDKDLFNYFEPEIQEVLRNAIEILNSTGKVNTLDKNPMFTYDLVKIIYTNMGLEFTLDILKYNAGADKQVINAINNGDVDLIKYYYDLVCKSNIFEKDDKMVHYAFRYFDQISDLIRDIRDKGVILNQEEIANLKNVILSNRFNVRSYEDLKNYNKTMQESINGLLASDDINNIKDYLAKFFGYNNVGVMGSEFKQFNFDNFSMIKKAIADIRNKYGDDVCNDLLLTKDDVKLIILMKKIIETRDIKVLKELINKYLVDFSNDVDFCDDVVALKAKYRLIMNYQFNTKLTKTSLLTMDAPEYENTGVRILDFDGQEFKFLAHRIHTFDQRMSNLEKMLLDDPSLWFKLEGATTLSCSSISDKGFHMLHSDSTSGVVYLFDTLPKEFMLFMYGRDLYVEHGGFKLEPTANKNSFTDIDGLNQNSCYHGCEWNEVAGFRNGMIPCGFACMGEEPNEETIRAAKFFSEHLGVDIPIIRFNVKKYEEQKVARLEEVKELLKNEVNDELLEEYFFDGIAASSIEEKTNYAIDCIVNNYKEGRIDYRTMFNALTRCEELLMRGYMGSDRHEYEVSKIIRKIQVYKQTLSLVKHMSSEEIISLENANMGETGIMYHMEDSTGEYLVKPAVDKNGLRPEAFRAEVQVSASNLQRMLNPSSAVSVEGIGSNKLRMSKQELLTLDDDKKTYLSDWVKTGGELDQHVLEQLLREYVVDMLLCNFDAYPGNFVIDSEGNLRGIDKEQSFRFIDNAETLDPEFSFVPNGICRIPIYKTIFERYKKGELDMDLSPIKEVIENVKLITDEEYRKLFRAYAEALNPDNPEELLDKIVKRKHDVTGNIERYVEKLSNIKGAGEFRI